MGNPSPLLFRLPNEPLLYFRVDIMEPLFSAFSFLAINPNLSL